MTSVITSKNINGGILAETLGVGFIQLTPVEMGFEVTVPDEVTIESLQAAIDAHVYVDIGTNRRTVVDAVALDLSTRVPEVKTAVDLIVAKANNVIGPADTKDLARQVRTLANAVTRIERMLLTDYRSVE